MKNYSFELICNNCKRTTSRVFEDTTESEMQNRINMGKSLLRHPGHLVCPGCHGILSVGIIVKQVV